MNEIVKVFNDRPVRIIDNDGQQWFVGKDVCNLLGYKDSTKAIKLHCYGGAKYHPIVDSLGRKQEVRILGEGDVMRLICGSKLPNAVRFERWVFDEVLPSIRKTGAYLSPAISDRQVEALITTLEQEVCRRIAAEQEMKCLQRQLEKLALAALPKSAFGEPSRTTGLPKDKVISTHLRSSRRPHRPQVEKYIQLLLPLYAARELLAEALLPVLGKSRLETREERNA